MAATRFKMHVLPPFIASSVAHEYEENRLPREHGYHASTATARLRLLCEHDCCCIASIVADGDEQFVNVSLIKGLVQSGYLDIDIGGARRGSECFDPAQVEFSIDKWADRFAHGVFDGKPAGKKFCGLLSGKSHFKLCRGK